MTTIAEKLVFDLLEVPGTVRIVLLQDGVIIKGNPTDDSKNYTGCLLIVQQCLHPNATPPPSYNDIFHTDHAASITAPTPAPRTSLFAEETVPSIEPITNTNGRGGGEGESSCSSSGNEIHAVHRLPGEDGYFLIWAPYTFLATRLPHLLSPTLRGRVAVAKERDSRSPVEWSFTMCTPIHTIARLQRRSTLRGIRVIAFTLISGHIECPLIFQNGGITKFLEAIKRIAPLRQSAVIPDDFILFGGPDNLPSSTAAANVSRAVVPMSLTRSVAPPPPRPFPGAASVHQMLYDRTPTNERWRATLATAIDAVRTGFRRGGFPMQRSPSPSISADTEDSGRMDQFELIDSPVPIEHQIPRITQPPSRTLSPELTSAQWEACFIGEERRLDPHKFAEARAVAYTGGIENEIRLQVWLSLLNAYPVNATEAERELARACYGQMYEKLTLQWTNIFPEQEQRFAAFRDLHTAILKDVVRTDRSHPAHADADGVKQQMLRDVLMAHAMYNFDLGYCQGMSDVLSVIVLLTESDVDAFACFTCMLRERCESNFRRDVRASMDAQLLALQTLIRHFVPRLYSHLVRVMAHDMSFCFRWLLMLFKREFPIDDATLLWDVILSCPYTPQFELFVAAALLRSLTPQILQQHLTYDELLKFANTIAGNVDVRHVIVLAQDFYDEVASRTAELDTGRKVPIGHYRPTLNDVLRVLGEAEQ